MNCPCCTKTNKIVCPYCGVDIDDHDTYPCLNLLYAEVALDWRWHEKPLHPEVVYLRPPLWVGEDMTVILHAPPKHLIRPNHYMTWWDTEQVTHKLPNYFRSKTDVWEGLEKIAEDKEQAISITRGSAYGKSPRNWVVGLGYYREPTETGIGRTINLAIMRCCIKFMLKDKQ